MYHLKNMLVCLDLTDMDFSLVRYASAMVRVLDASSVTFMHVFEPKALPGTTKDLLANLDTPIGEAISEELHERVEEHFSARNGISIEVLVDEGGAAKKIVERAHAREVDLILAGRKPGVGPPGTLVSNVVLRAHCTVLLVPDRPVEEIRQILAPVDFSRHSRMAIEQAEYLAERTGARVICQHVYHVEARFFPYVSIEDGYEKPVRERLQRQYEEFLTSSTLDPNELSCTFTLDERDDVAETICEYAFEAGADLIVIGSRGRSAAASLMVGSIARELIRHARHIPVMIVKDRKKNLGLLELLLGKRGRD